MFHGAEITFDEVLFEDNSGTYGNGPKITERNAFEEIVSSSAVKRNKALHFAV